MSSSSTTNPYIPVMELPLLVRKNILVHADNEAFQKWCSYPQFAPLCGTNYNAQDVYRERCERLFDSEILKFKDKTVSWRDFYYLATLLISDIKRGIFSTINYDTYHQLKVYGNKKNGTILLSMISILFPQIFQNFKVQLLNHMIDLEKFETVEWLLNFTRLSDIYENVINDAYYYGREKLIEFLIEHDIIPTQDNIDLLASEDNLDTMKKLKEKYGYLPSSHAIYSAIYQDNRIMLQWLLNQSIIPDRNSLNMVYEQDNLPVYIMLINAGMLSTQREFESLNKNSDIRQYLIQNPQYIIE